MPQANRDPFVGFHFIIDFGAKCKGMFKECGGLGSEHEVVEHKFAGGVPTKMEGYQKLPGRLKWENISLKRGLTDNLEMWNWRQEIIKGKIKGARVDGTIMLLDHDGSIGAEWKVSQAWPSKVSGPQLNASGNDYAVEELTIVHEGVERMK